MKEEVNELDQIVEDAAQDLREAIDNYARVFARRTGRTEKFLTIDQLEEMMLQLDGETRKIYLSMVSDSLNSIDEKELIASKKESSKGRG